MQRITCPDDVDWEFDWANGNSLAAVRFEVNGIMFPVHSFTYHSTHTEKVTGWWPGAAAGPARLAYSYNIVNGALTQIDLATRDFTNVRGGGSSTLTSRVRFDSLGRVYETTNPRGDNTAFTYHAHSGPVAKGRYLLKRIEGAAAGANLAIEYTCDDLGRPSAIRRGLTGGVRETLIGIDTLHRATSVRAKAVASWPDLVSENYFDHRGAVTLARRENRDERERRQGWQGGSNSAVASVYGWDDLRRLASIETNAWGGASYNQVRSRFDHTYDREGHMLARKWDRVGQPGGGDIFKLDEYYRLAGAKLGVEATQFAQFTAQPPTLTFG